MFSDLPGKLQSLEGRVINLYLADFKRHQDTLKRTENPIEQSSPKGILATAGSIFYEATRFFRSSDTKPSESLENEQLQESPEVSGRREDQLQQFFQGTKGEEAFNAVLKQYQIPEDLGVRKNGDTLTLTFDKRRLNQDAPLTPDEYKILDRVVSSANLEKPQGDKKALNKNPKEKETYTVSDLSSFCTIGSGLFKHLKSSEFGPKIILKKSGNVISFVEPKLLKNASIELKENGVLNLSIKIAFMTFPGVVVLDDLVQLLSLMIKISS